MLVTRDRGLIALCNRALDAGVVDVVCEDRGPSDGQLCNLELEGIRRGHGGEEMSENNGWTRKETKYVSYIRGYQEQLLSGGDPIISMISPIILSVILSVVGIR